MGTKQTLAGPGQVAVAGAAAYVEGPGASGSDFDFFVGEWDVHVTYHGADGGVDVEQTGRWSARSLFDGRMIEDCCQTRDENGVDVAAVVTLRTYCVATAQWEMVFLWAQRPVPTLTSFVGNRVDGEMRLTAQQLTPDGSVIPARIRFYEITKDSFLWESCLSFDGGATWRVQMAIKARRSAA